MTKSILSIIIPIYNVERYIAGCLDSIVKQLVDSVEVIVVNDGTPDKSMDIVNEYAVRYPITIVNQQNQGLSMARNNGLKAAHCEYVWFVDSDDTLLDGAIELVLETINEHRGIDVIASVLLQKQERTGHTAIEYIPDYNVKTGREYMFRGNHLGASQRYILRKKFLLENELWFMPNIYHEDGEFGHKMMYLAESVFVLPKPVYCYLLRGQGSIMSSRKPKMNYDLIKIYLELESFCKERVREEDKIKYLASAAICVYDTIMFSRSIIFSNEFKTFYKDNKILIKRVAGQFLPHYNELSWRDYRRSLHFYFFPLFWTRLKYCARVVLDKIK